MRNLGLDDYIRSCKDAGFTDWQSLTQITEFDMAALNMPLGYRRRLQREIARRNSWPDYKALPTTAQPMQHIPASTIQEAPRTEQPTDGSSQRLIIELPRVLFPLKPSKRIAPNASEILKRTSTWTWVSKSWRKMKSSGCQSPRERRCKRPRRGRKLLCWRMSQAE